MNPVMESRLGRRDSTTAEERLQLRAKKRILIGLALIFTSIPVSLFLVPTLIPVPWRNLAFYIGLAIGVSLTILGLVSLLYLSTATETLLSAIKTIRLISQEEPTITDSFVLAKANSILLLGTERGHLYFIALRHLTPTSQRRIRLPRPRLSRSYRHHVGGLRVARYEGTYTLPVSRDEYVKAQALIYVLPIAQDYVLFLLRMVYYYKRPQLLAIVNALAREAEAATQETLNHLT